MPVIASNRINTPELADRLIADGKADMVSMARPFLSDPDFVAKARAGRRAAINVCIGCNQACLDNAFTGKLTTCMVNPAACREAEFGDVAAPIEPKRIAVVGAGPAGLAAAVTSAERGHKVTLFERSEQIGGQFNLARRIPGKEDYAETIGYYGARLSELGVEVRLGTLVGPQELIAAAYDHVILATGVEPRTLDSVGVDDPRVLTYAQAIETPELAGDTVAILGAGGIGFDVAQLLAHPTGTGDPAAPDIEGFSQEWGIDTAFTERGALQTAAHVLALGPTDHALPAQTGIGVRRGPEQDAGLGQHPGGRAPGRRHDRRCRLWPPQPGGPACHGGRRPTD